MRTFLSPFAHELNGQGTACAHDCPACRWVEESQIESLIPAIFSRQTDRETVRQKKPQGKAIEQDTLVPALSR